MATSNLSTLVHHTRDHTTTVEKIQPIEVQNAEILAHLQEQRVNTVVQEEQEEEGGLQQLLIDSYQRYCQMMEKNRMFGLP